MKPGEKWLVGYELVKMPSLQCTEWPFWDPQKLSKDSYDLGGTLRLGRDLTVPVAGSEPIIRTFRLGRHLTVPVAGPAVTIRPRRKAEMAKLLELCRGRGDAWTKKNRPVGFDDDRANMNWFGFTFAPPECSQSENLAMLEKLLSPGSLRDIVHLTRLAQAVYDEKDVTQRRKNLASLCAWLETLPEVERKWMAIRVTEWAAPNQGLGPFRFEVATEAALRLQAGDRDPNLRKFHESRGMGLISEYAPAASYRKDFEERLKAVEKRLEQRRNQDRE